jgi:hypothetical protein
MHSSKFVEFFDSLIDIFQIPNDQSFKNVVGLYGELSIIKNIYDTYKVDISPFWHLNGSSSKYDFSLKNFNLEIKTTSSKNKMIDIKHYQIFNNENNILGTVKISTGLYLIPVITIFFAAIFLNEKITLMGTIGSALTIIGLFVSSKK